MIKNFVSVDNLTNRKSISHPLHQLQIKIIFALKMFNLSQSQLFHQQTRCGYHLHLHHFVFPFPFSRAYRNARDTASPTSRLAQSRCVRRSLPTTASSPSRSSSLSCASISSASCETVALLLASSSLSLQLQLSLHLGFSDPHAPDFQGHPHQKSAAAKRAARSRARRACRLSNSVSRRMDGIFYPLSLCARYHSAALDARGAQRSRCLHWISGGASSRDSSTVQLPFTAVVAVLRVSRL